MVTIDWETDTLAHLRLDNAPTGPGPWPGINLNQSTTQRACGCSAKRGVRSRGLYFGALNRAWSLRGVRLQSARHASG
jgi:hypothetical protein